MATFLASAALAAATQPGVPNCTVSWHTQPLDHFDFAESRTWRQRVLRHDGYHKKGGPILFYTGNEANVELYVNATGWMWERAAGLGAAPTAPGGGVRWLLYI